MSFEDRSLWGLSWMFRHSEINWDGGKQEVIYYSSVIAEVVSRGKKTSIMAHVIELFLLIFVYLKNKPISKNVQNTNFHRIPLYYFYRYC